MINAWSLAYDVLNGTLDENFPIKKKKMTDEIKLEGADEGVVNVPDDINLDQDINIKTTSDKEVFNVSSDGLKQEHSDYWYDYTRNDPDRENPFTDAFDYLMGESVTGKTPWIYESPDGGKTVYRHERGTDPLKRELVVDTLNIKTSGIEDKTTIRKYKEDESIKALQDYISTTYGGHYTSDNNNVQTLDLIESVGDAESFCRSNAIKYLSRYDKKGQAKRDILKALHYSLLLYHFSGQLNETPTRGYETF